MHMWVHLYIYMLTHVDVCISIYMLAFECLHSYWTNEAPLSVIVFIHIAELTVIHRTLILIAEILGGFSFFGAFRMQHLWSCSAAAVQQLCAVGDGSKRCRI